jgi:hypothetical protein
MQNGDTLGRIEYFYNDQNLAIEKIYFDSTDIVVGREVMDYDINGNIITYTRFEGDNQVFYCERDWNSSNLLLLEKKFDQDNQLIYKGVFVYDDEGLLLSYTSLNPPSDLKTTIYEYDAEQRCTLELHYLGVVADGNLYQKIRKEYNEQGLLSKWQFFGPNDEPGRYYLYEYNEMGDITLFAEYDIYGNLLIQSTSGYIYDSNGDIIDRIGYDINGNYSGRTIYGRDIYGNILEKSVYDVDGNINEQIVSEFECFEQDIH